MRYRKLIPKPSLREQVSTHRRWLDMMADSVGHERMPVTQTEQALAVRRTRIRKPSDPTRILEKHVLKAVLDYLRRHPKVAMVYRVNSGTFTQQNRDGSERYIRANSAKGMADIMGTLKDGRTLACECKAPGKQLMAHQKAFLDAITKAGGLAFVARSVDDVMAALNG